MSVLAGLVLWLAAGVVGARVATLLRLRGPGAEVFTIAWGIFGAFVGGIVGVFPSLPEHGVPWRPGSLAGALIGAVVFGLLYRVLRRRATSVSRTWVRVGGLALLALASVGLGAFTWFALAVMTPRLYQPKYNPRVEAVLAQSCRPDSSVVGPCVTRLARTYLARPENAGIVIGAWLNGERVLVSGGVASRTERTPITVGSLFEVGSITKVFTALALARAVTAGEVRLDQRVVDLLPKDPRLAGLPITLEDLATHYSGLPNNPPSLPWWTALIRDDPYDRLTEQDLVASLAVSARSLPATRSYAYSTFGFTLLGDALERAAGRPFPQLLAERVFRPLGMFRTRVISGDSLEEGPVEGYSLGQRMPHWIGHRQAGAVGAVSCANDLLTLIEAEIRLKPDSLRAPLQLAATARRKAEANHLIGLGWQIRVDGQGHRFVHHAGHTPGFYAYVGYSAESRVGVVVLANSSDPTAESLGSRLLDVLSSGGPWPAAAASATAPGDPASSRIGAAIR